MMINALGKEDLGVFAAPFPFPNGHRQELSMEAEELTAGVEVTVPVDVLLPSVEMEVTAKRFEDAKDLTELIDGEPRLDAVRRAVRNRVGFQERSQQSEEPMRKSLGIIIRLKELLRTTPVEDVAKRARITELIANEWAAFGACDCVLEERNVVLKMRDLLLKAERAERATAEAEKAVQATEAAEAAEAPAEAGCATCLAAAAAGGGGEASGAGAGNSGAAAASVGGVSLLQTALYHARVKQATAELEVDVTAALVTGAAVTTDANPERAEQQLKTPFGVLEFDGATTVRSCIAKRLAASDKAFREMMRHSELRMSAMRQQSDAILASSKVVTTTHEELRGARRAVDDVNLRLRATECRIREVERDLEAQRRASIHVIHREHILAADDCIRTSTEELAQLNATQEVLRAELAVKKAVVTELNARMTSALELLRSSPSSISSCKRKFELATVEAVEASTAKLPRPAADA